MPSVVSHTQCLLSKKQSSSGRYGIISNGDMFFLPPPKYAFHFWLTNLYHILLSLLPLHYVVRHINMVRYHLGYIPIRSAGSSISGITATAVAPYPTTTSNKVGESVLVILTLNWSASTIFHWVKGYLFHILISHSGTLWLGRFHPPTLYATAPCQ